MSSKLAINDLFFSEQVLGSELQSINGGKGFFDKVKDAATDVVTVAVETLDGGLPPIVDELLPCAIGATVGGVTGCLAADYVVNS
jgi:hypothetical protein